MEKAKVYFTDFRCPVGTSALDKLQRLCKAAHMGDIDFQGKFTAIKMHFGELGNLATIRPQYVKAVADLVKEWGGETLPDGLQYPVSREPEKRPGPSGLRGSQWLQHHYHRLPGDHRGRAPGHR